MAFRSSLVAILLLVSVHLPYSYSDNWIEMVNMSTVTGLKQKNTYRFKGHKGDTVTEYLVKQPSKLSPFPTFIKASIQPQGDQLAVTLSQQGSGVDSTSCPFGRYGPPECSRHCVAQDDESGGHYTCNATGHKVCRPLWLHADTNCKTEFVPSCDPNPCKYDGNCSIKNKSIVCACPGLTFGYLCKHCKGYFDEQDGGLCKPLPPPEESVGEAVMSSMIIFYIVAAVSALVTMSYLIYRQQREELETSDEEEDGDVQLADPAPGAIFKISIYPMKTDEFFAVDDAPASHKD